MRGTRSIKKREREEQQAIIDAKRQASCCQPVVAIPWDVLISHIFPFAFDTITDGCALMLVCWALRKHLTTSMEFWGPFLNRVKRKRYKWCRKPNVFGGQDYVSPFALRNSSVIAVLKSKFLFQSSRETMLCPTEKNSFPPRIGMKGLMPHAISRKKIQAKGQKFSTISINPFRQSATYTEFIDHPSKGFTFSYNAEQSRNKDYFVCHRSFCEEEVDDHYRFESTSNDSTLEVSVSTDSIQINGVSFVGRVVIGDIDTRCILERDCNVKIHRKNRSVDVFLSVTMITITNDFNHGVVVYHYQMLTPNPKRAYQDVGDRVELC